jgi:hypothetical protein
VTETGVPSGARVWHSWLRILRLLRDIVGGSAWEARGAAGGVGCANRTA